jgi:hypothetical protein
MFMQKPVIFLAGLLLVLIACGKNKYNTKPSLTLKSISSNPLAVGQPLIFDFEFTDKEGDISDSIFLKKIRVNQVQVPVIEPDTFGFPVPSFPEKPKGDITLSLDYNLHVVAALNPPTQGNPPTPVPDTLVFKFVLRDKAGNVSDTVTTAPIAVFR